MAKTWTAMTPGQYTAAQEFRRKLVDTFADLVPRPDREDLEEIVDHLLRNYAVAEQPEGEDD